MKSTKRLDAAIERYCTASDSTYNSAYEHLLRVAWEEGLKDRNVEREVYMGLMFVSLANHVAYLLTKE